MDGEQQLVLPHSFDLLGPIGDRSDLVRASPALEQRALAPARALGAELLPLAVTPPPPPPTGHEIVQDARGAFWVLADDVHDPTQRDGRIPIPVPQRETLKRLFDGGVDLDYVYLAHELPADWQPNDPIPSLVPPAPRVRTAERAMAAMAELLLTAVRRSASAADAIRTAHQSARGLDPVILGGVMTDDGAAVAWIVIAEWTWD